MNRRQELLDRFGSIYIDFVRDSTLKIIQNILDDTAQAKSDKILFQEISKIPQEYKKIIEIIVSETLDTCLHYTLFMLQEYEDEMQLIMHDEDYHQYSLAEISDGLCGELYSEDGWIAKYSKYPNWLEDIEDSKEK